VGAPANVNAAFAGDPIGFKASSQRADLSGMRIAAAPTRWVALGAAIGLIVLLLANGLRPAPADRSGRPPAEQHVLHGGLAELRLPVGTSDFFLFDRKLYPTERWVEAARDAWESGRFVGAGEGVVVAIVPGQRKPAVVPVGVALRARAPGLRRQDEHVVDVDLDVGSGGLVLLPIAPGAPAAPHEVAVPAGAYRVRIAGRAYGFDEAKALRIDLWPRRRAEPPRELRHWSGWLKPGGFQLH
jgi:hypothetical protein